jgi:transcriptional activator
MASLCPMRQTSRTGCCCNAKAGAARANTVFERLSGWQRDAGELENALETTIRWVEHDLLNEIAHARLMQLHYARGDRVAALQAFERCRAILERELSVEPSSEVMGLAERIRSQALPVGESVMHEQSRHGRRGNRHSPGETPSITRWSGCSKRCCEAAHRWRPSRESLASARHGWQKNS